MNVQPNAEAIEAGAQALQDAPSDRTMIHTFSLADDGVSAVDTKRVEVHVEPGEAARAVLAAAMPHLRAQWLAEARAALLDVDRFYAWLDGVHRTQRTGHPTRTSTRERFANYLADTLGGTTTGEPTPTPAATWTGPGCCQAAYESEGQCHDCGDNVCPHLPTMTEETDR